MNIKTDTLIEIERDACLSSFYEFFLSFWDTVVQEDLIDNWHIKYICDELQYVSTFVKERKKKPYDLIFNVPPGSTKTTIVLQMYPAWLWAIDPTIRIISSSHSAPLSIEKISKAASEPDRIKAIDHMKTLFTREVEKGNSINVLIMQRLHELDCTAYLKGLSVKRKVKHICLPAKISELVNPPELRERYTDGLMDPVRMSNEVLAEKEVELGIYGYTSQFDQEPTPPILLMKRRKRSIRQEKQEMTLLDY